MSLITVFLVSVFSCFPIKATELTNALIENKSLVEIRELIKKGSDVNQPDEKTGLYPLMLTKDTAILQELINAGADINNQNKGENLLFAAIEQNNIEMLEYLLSKGLDVNATNLAGETPLIQAVLFSEIHENTDIIKMLLKYGADKTIQNNQGLTASDYAFRLNHEIQNLLKPSISFTKSAEKFYTEMKESILKEEILPLVQKDISDQTKIQSIMKQIEDSIDMDQVMTDTWPCLSKEPENQWKFTSTCFFTFRMYLMEKTGYFTAKANEGF